MSIDSYLLANPLHIIPILTAMRKKTFEKVRIKPIFSYFPAMFSYPAETNAPICSTYVTHMQTRKNQGLFGKGLTWLDSAFNDYFRLFIVATGCPTARRPQKTVSCYGG